MKLIRALRYSIPVSVAFVGAGGKTTAIFRAARELLAADQGGLLSRTVLVTTSTHFGTWQAKFADEVKAVNSIQDIQKLGKELHGIVLLFGDENNDRLSGLAPNVMEAVHRLVKEQNLPLLIEADGAHTRPLKVPAEYEPAIPEFVEVVVVVAGVSGLGKPLTDEWVHRPERFTEITGLLPGENITSEPFVKMLLSKKGGLKGIPAQARRLVLLTQADSPELQSQAKTIGEKLLPAYQSSIISSLSSADAKIPAKEDQTCERETIIHAVIEQIGGVILAAGSSSRFGEPKQLLTWKGKPLLWHVAQNAIKSRLSPVLVVVGFSAEKVQSATKDLPVRIVNNSEWMNGMSTSIKAGLTGLSGDVGGVVFLQADQPQIPQSLISSLVEAHRASMNPIIAPQINGQRGNPVLFDVDTFPDLLRIDGDMGGRALFSRYRVEWVTWHDPNLLLDIDSPEDFQTFLQRYREGEVEA
jgi:molybdenum cofactor cytidylyltransferase